MKHKIIGSIALSCSLSGCGLSIFTDPLTNPIIEDQIGPIFGEEKLATLATTSSRRTITVRLTDIVGNSVEGMFCAEPSPDTAENVANSISSAIKATISQPEVNASGSGSAEYAKALATSIEALSKRSQGLQLYRDSSYQLCQALLNKAITKSQFYEMSTLLLTASVELIKQELTLTKGAISAPQMRTVLPKTKTTITMEDGKTVTESTTNP